MKIVFIDQIAEVNNKYSFSLLNRLKKKHEVFFVSDEKPFNDKDVKVYNLFNGTTSTELSKANKALVYMKAWKTIYKMCIENNIDVLHIQWFILSPIDAHYIKKIKNLGIKIIVTVHDILPFNEMFYDYSNHKKIYDMADKIIVQAKPNIERINKMFDNLESKVVYIPHGNFVEHVNIIEKDKARELLNIHKDKKVILFFGQIKKVKGLDVLIRAYGELISKSNDDNLLLLIAGKVWGEDFTKYEKLIDELNIRDKVKLDIKYIKDEEVDWYYNAADINVLPYRELYQSGVVHLAYGYKTPVIATRVGSFPEVIIDKVTGILIEKDNYKELSEAINDLVYDEEKIKNMGQAGRNHIEENFSWDKIADKISNLYTE